MMEKERGERFWMEVLSRPVLATNTDEGIRAVRKKGWSAKGDLDLELMEQMAKEP
jgi:hypothetical protein